MLFSNEAVPNMSLIVNAEYDFATCVYHDFCQTN